MRHLALARLRLAERRPYYATAACRLIPCTVPGLGTVAVDDTWRLAIDPAAVNDWTVEQFAGVLEHELGHLLRAHATRARALGVDDRSALRFNLAADAEINDDLVANSVALPGQSVRPESLGLPDGQLAEWYFDRLPADLSRPATGRIHRHGTHSECLPDCGPAAHGQPADWQRGLEETGVSSLEAELLRRQTAAQVVRHSRGRGAVPAGLMRWAEQTLRPVVDWRRVLARTIRASSACINGRVDHTYSRPSRRASTMHPIIVPALYQPKVETAIVIDTSGSMSAEQLNSALSETGSLMAATGQQSLKVISCDTTPTVRTIAAGSLHKAVLVGGGGTDMCAGLRAAHEMRPQPRLVVVFTDGITPWPERVPRAVQHVVVVIGALMPTPDWAQLVHVPDDELCM